MHADDLTFVVWFCSVVSWPIQSMCWMDIMLFVTQKTC